MDITPDVIASNRIGCFTIDEKQLLSPDILVIMSMVVIIRCEHLYDLKAFEYVGYSNLFKSLPDNHGFAPRYFFEKSSKTGEFRAVQPNQDSTPEPKPEPKEEGEKPKTTTKKETTKQKVAHA